MSLNENNFGVILIVLICSLLSCSSESNDPNSKTYEGVLLNAVTDQPIPGVAVRLDHYFGGQSVLDSDIDVTDENGKFTIHSTINDDSLAIELEKQMLDSNTIWQRLYIEAIEYTRESIIQKGTALPIAPRYYIEEGEFITLTAWPSGLLQLTFQDTINTELYGSTSVEIRSEDAEDGFLYRFGNFDNQANDWTIGIPSDMPIIMSWETYEGPTYDSTEFVRSGSTEFNLAFKESKSFILYQ